MRYVPKLIPPNARVLPDYFKGDIYKATKKNMLKDALMWILGLWLFLPALAFIHHPLIPMVYGLIGLILVPPGHHFIEKKLRFRLTTKIKIITIIALLIGSIPLVGHYVTIDKQQAYRQKLLDRKTANEKAVAEQKEQQRKDSLSYYLRQTNQLANTHNIDEAGKQLQHARTFAVTPADDEQIEREKNNIAAIKTDDLLKAGKYQAALPELNSLLQADPANTKLLYNRAVCYSKTGKIQDAVNDLKPLIQAGNADAEKLHNKINPVRKRIIGYETLCCDGTTSDARGQGACSHHGGVCDWNHPIYDEYRKYE